MNGSCANHMIVESAIEDQQCWSFKILSFSVLFSVLSCDPYCYYILYNNI